MNSNEFEQFWSGHQVCFPTDRAKWEKLLGSEEAVTAQKKLWNRMLEQVEFSDARIALREMKEGDALTRFDKLDNHPGIVRRISTRLRHQRRAQRECAGRLRPNEEPRYYCLDCMDVGRVFCYHDETTDTMRKGRTPETRYTMAVDCHCTAGERYRSERNPASLLRPRYDLKRHCTLRVDGHVYGANEQRALDHLYEWIESTKDWTPQPGGYEATIAASEKEFE